MFRVLILCTMVLLASCNLLHPGGAESPAASESPLKSDAAGCDGSKFVDQDGDGIPFPQDCNDHDPTVYPGAPELCDLVDNNCNGQVDENWYHNNGAGLGKPCTVKAENNCISDGVWVCNPNHNELICNAVPREPLDYEKCNGVDDDCNGYTDEDWPDLGKPCQTEYGRCLFDGVISCDSYTEESYCSGENLIGYYDDGTCWRT